MKLSECPFEKTDILRDGTFLSAGTLFSTGPQQVVCLVREGDVAKIERNPAISCVITTPGLVPKIPERIGTIAVGDPRSAFYTILAFVSNNPEFSLPGFGNRISPSARIHPTAVIAATSVAIGRDVVIEKNVVIHEQTIIDEGSVVRSNSVIGLGQRHPDRTLQPLPVNAGGVHLHRETDIHANTCIHRAAFRGYTEIGEQTKIDNLDVVGQGTRIGNRCLICAGVTIGESVSIGDDGWIGPNVSVEDQLSIGKNTYLTIGSTVTRDIGDDQVAKDNYTIDRKRFRKVIRGM